MYRALEVVFQNISGNATSYTWDFGNGQSGTSSRPNVSAMYNDAGAYRIILIASNGICTDTAQLMIIIGTAPDFLVRIPTIFTPNGHHVNDIFYIGMTNAKAGFIETFNRWGNTMTKLEKPTNTRNGGDAPSGVYYYSYKITDQSGKLYEGQGFFHLEKGSN